MSERVIELTGYRTGYEGVVVVNDIDLHVDAGEIVALLGPNGAGKSTTLLGISGLLPTLAGTALVNGRPVDTKRPHRSARDGVAHVPEDRGLLPTLTVAENLRLGRRGHKDAEAEVLDLFPALTRLLDRRAGLLSGGEQQMLSLARALVSRPNVLLIDEMSLGLAPLIVQNLVTKVGEIAASSGVGVLMVEQHVHMALSVADRAYAMSKGRIVLQGTAAELAERSDLLTAGYLGGLDELADGTEPAAAGADA